MIMNVKERRRGRRGEIQYIRVGAYGFISPNQLFLSSSPLPRPISLSSPPHLNIYLIFPLKSLLLLNTVKDVGVG